MDEIEAIEQYVILLLGVDDSRPIPSATHLQKELFILSKANPRMANVLSFEKHHYGPYSLDIEDISKNPVYNPDAFVFDADRSGYYITEKGKEIFKRMVAEHLGKPRFGELLAMMKMARDLYDRLSADELLFLIYVTYEEYTERSDKSRELLSSPNRERLARNLLGKGLVTESRYAELVTR